MAHPRRRTLGEDDEMDITYGFDEEKRGLVARDTSVDVFSVNSSPASSRNGYTSQDAMLRGRGPPPRRSMRSSIFYRVPNRTMRWLCIALMSSVILFILSLFRMSQLSTLSLQGKEPERPPPVWESFPFMNRYYGGIRTLTSIAEHQSEFPHGDEHPQVDTEITTNRSQTNSMPTPRVYDPYPDYSSPSYVAQWSRVETCYLDEAETVTVPRVQSYEGAVQGVAEPIMGSYELLGLSGNQCHDRYARLGAYGFGYSKNKGGLGAGLDGEKEGSEHVWRTTRQVDYRKVQWADLQSRCYHKNQHRFTPAPAYIEEKWRDMGPMTWGNATPPSTEAKHGKSGTHLPRTAVVIRIWHEFAWTQEAILYMRSLISELSLLSGGEYHVHFLVHVKNDTHPIWASEEVYEQTLRDALPAEFHGMGTLWSERQMLLVYDGLQESFFRGLPVHGVYRSAHFPLQYFAHKHPEYDFFWNWEMDIRYTGHWYSLFDAVRTFARNQPRKGLWERNERFYVPSVHGSWDDFKAMVRVQSEMPTPQTNKFAHAGPPGATEPVAEPPVWGRKAPIDAPVLPEDPEPPHSYSEDRNEWGVGEEADLITFNPIFNPEHTGWLLADDATGYNESEPLPPRRTAIITASRLSGRLLNAMHTETSLYRHTMFSEMFPATMALHHGYKAVYAPHPVFIDRAWPPSYLAKTFNGGFNGAAGGARTSPFNADLEHNFMGVTWYYNAGFSGNLWRRWLGLRSNNDGGEEWEKAQEGRMCLPPMLLHPIRDFDFAIEEPGSEDPPTGPTGDV
jgi:Protein of unknown function (DUF3405)